MPYGLELAQASGAQAAGNAINEGFGLSLAKQKRDAQMKAARGLQNIELEGEAIRMTRNEEMAMRMFENTGYGAQVNQMKKAGINPALLYGMSAGGGTTQAQGISGGGGGGAQPPQASRGAEGMGIMIGQMGLLQAQKENIEADTANKKASNPNIQADTAGKDLDNRYKKGTLDDRIDIINTEAATKIAELDIKEGERNEQRMSRMDRMNKIKAEAIGELIHNGLMEMQKKGIIQNIEESKAKIINMQQQIEQGLRGLDQKDTELKIREFEAMIKAEFPSLWNVIGGAVNGIIQMGSGNDKPKTYKSPTQK